MARFLEAGDALEAAEGVFIKNIVVADPELEGKAGANWNEAVEDFVVADGPWYATDDDQDSSEGRHAPGNTRDMTGTNDSPGEQEGESDG